ncbi:MULTISPECIES: ATP-binding cassette domain-containing protein [unclassified Modicisalibacter]|uniref:ATP-binding cassette domain-containing protein n=1 Tax=unclassified Modicisalibacter TaxID=2679913 RepID=UPI001CCE6F2A|nr:MULTISPECIES: ATP-binding cassette domain-containing protein [unclassified Modicisalibacter]MBZ9559914.1 ATP-binding cassette domain-containing protein [Modicisalibacter sp. R2A 31.J]MBZ9575822.1 ATP-binding cassette domain-containing protein [Modicisalibacter sp. MOD 31.J]
MNDLSRTDPAPAPLHLERLTIRLAGEPLVTLDATIAPGEILTVMGPSGSGKSTLLATIAGFLAPAFTVSGRVRLGETVLDGLAPETRHVGLLFQDPLLFPHLSVGGNLAFGMVPGGGRRERRRRIAAALDEVGLAGYAERDPATLSGGQKARVALLRVLLAEPRAMLLDEPFSKLDAALRDDLRRLVFARVRERRLPTLMVTHDIADAEAAGGRVIELTN